MKPKFNENKPRFQTVEERRDNKFQTKSNRFEDKPRFDKPKFGGDKACFDRKDHQEAREAIYPTIGKKAAGEGNVQISVKGGNNTMKEKKPARFLLAHRRKLRKIVRKK